MRTLRRKLVLALGLVVIGAGTFTAGAADGPSATPAKLSWYGQACFLLETGSGTRVLMDPIPAGLGYDPPVGMRADLVTVSHEHGDHNNVALAGGKPRVLRGLTADKKGWNKINEKVKDVSVRAVGVYHDDEGGKKRGLNTVFVFETGGLRIAHLGDLGHTLTDEQISALGSVDVLLVPVGGTFTIDAQQAQRVVDQIRPRLVVVPMHYKTDVLTIKELATVDAFVAGRSQVRRESSNTLVLTSVKKRPGAEVVVLGYK